MARTRKEGKKKHRNRKNLSKQLKRIARNQQLLEKYKTA